MTMVLAACLMVGAAVVQGQSPAPGQAPAQSDNPFPADAAPAKPKAPAPAQANPAASDNPFPGEDTNAPIIPVDQNGPGAPGAPRPGYAPPAGSGSSPTEQRDSSEKTENDPDGDPVRSPDGAANVVDDGFSSSRAGLKPDLAEAVTDAKAGSSVRTKTREEVMKEDLDVGNFYLSKKDWKGALGRFQDAFALDVENPDAVWGLAEAERHMQMPAKAIEHYKLFLSYDPDGPHGKEARKALQQAESMLPAPGTPLAQPK
jgi:tetratricopeptide (TPR) repeat protein